MASSSSPSLPPDKSIEAKIPAPLPATPNVTLRRGLRLSKTVLAILAILAILSLAAVALYRLDRYGGVFYPAPNPPWCYDDPCPEGSVRIPDPEDWEPPVERVGPSDPIEPLKRYSFFYGRVACWSDNGVYVANLSPVEMAWLGVDRFRETDRAESQADEDAFCARLRLHGASFWELPPRWDSYDERGRWCESINCLPPVRKVSVEVGFPAGGGVWVLDTKNRAPDEPNLKRGHLRHALTMDERCEVLKDLGAHFCGDIKKCPQLDAALEGTPGEHRDAEMGGSGGAEALLDDEELLPHIYVSHG